MATPVINIVVTYSDGGTEIMTFEQNARVNRHGRFARELHEAINLPVTKVELMTPFDGKVDLAVCRSSLWEQSQ